MESNKPKYAKGTPRGHHYVPRRYLVGFCAPGTQRLSLYDRERNEYRENALASGLAKKKDFYALTNAEGDKDFSFESELERFESEGIDVICKIDSREKITSAEKKALAIYASLQQKRTIAFQKTFETAIEFSVRHILTEVFDEIEEKTGGLLFSDPESKISLLEKVGKDVPKDVRRNAGIEAIIEAAERDAESLLQLGWTILYRPNQKTAFITTDSPFCSISMRTSDEDASLGIANNFQVLPLSQNSVLVMLQGGGDVEERILTRKEVREVNVQVAARCKDYVFGRERELIERIVKECGIGDFKWKLKIEPA